MKPVTAQPRRHACHHRKRLLPIIWGWAFCPTCGSVLNSDDGRTPALDPDGQFVYADFRTRRTLL